jgi:hypothetical protein
MVSPARAKGHCRMDHDDTSALDMPVERFRQ